MCRLAALDASAQEYEVVAANVHFLHLISMIGAHHSCDEKAHFDQAGFA